MSNYHIGATKVAASRIGITHAEYMQRVEAGLKWCCTCKKWLRWSCFGRVDSRGDMLNPQCRICISVRDRRRYQRVKLARRKAYESQ